MKNNKYFSLSLYFQGIKQLKKVGIFLLIVISTLSLFTFYGSETFVYTYFDINPMLTLMFILIAPVLTISLFRTFNKRNASDFYYSIPYSRTCIYISYVLSVITWIIGIFLIILIPSILSAIYFRNVTIIYYEMVIEFLGIIAASLLVTSAITLAMSLTGKLYSNILLSGIIIFIPRMLIYFFIFFTLQEFSHLEVENFWGILNLQYNIVTHSLGAMFYSNLNYISTESVIYTFVLAIIYFIISGICYSKRKSDTAQTISSKPVQFIITGTLPTLICIVTYRLKGIIYFYIIGIIIFFIFEFTISRNLTKSLKKIPLFLIAILIGHIFDSSIYFIGNTTRTTILEADEIDYITLASEVNMYYHDDNNNYYELLSYETKINDKYILDKVSESLEMLNQKYYEVNYDYFSLPIAIHSGNKVYYRNLFFSPYAIEINQALEENEELLTKSTTLPDYSDAYIESRDYFYNKKCSQNEIKNIYKEYLKELEFYNTKTKKDILYESISISEAYEIGIYFMYKGRLAKIPYAELSREYTPNSYEAYDKLNK